MVFIVSASVLSHTLYPKEHKNFYVKRQLISKPTLERYKKFIYCVPGLSCHPRAKNPQKTVQHVLGRLYPEANNVIIWHDAINNTLSAHPNNFNQPATVNELLQALEPFRHRILALVHCHRTGVPDIYKELRRSEFFALSVTRDIVSYRSATCFAEQYKLIHPPAVLEVKTLTLVLHHQSNLRDLVRRRKPLKRNKKLRRALKVRAALASGSELAVV